MGYKTIMVSGDGAPKEGIASGAITPGQLLSRTSAAGTFIRHATQGGDIVPKIVAVEDDLQGNEIEDDYATTARVFARIVQPGDEVNCLLADGQNAAIGDELESNGDGDLKTHTAAASNSNGAFDEGGESIYSQPIFGVALEALDMSDTSGADPASRRILVEVS